MELLAGAVAPVMELVRCLMFDPIRYCWKYHTGVEENMATLKRKVVALKTRKSAIESQQATELKPGKALGDDVECWLDTVEEIDKEIGHIENKVRNVKYFCRACLGKQIHLKTNLVEKLYEEGKFPNGLFISLKKRGELLPTKKILGGESTFKRKMDEIFSYLTDHDEVGSIGVYGMAGVGKTTALEHTNNRLVEDHKCKFDHVIWIDVTKDSDVRNLQDRIARKLDIDISICEDQRARAIKLHEMLITKKRYVLILDDLWNAFNLEEVGIPEPTSKNECKLVLATRSDDVCRVMRCKQVIEMELPSEDEALQLFSEIVGYDDKSEPELEENRKAVVQQCGRLPLAIVTTANRLTGSVDCDEWELVLEELKDYMKGSVLEKIIETLKCSYDHLNDGKYQQCLLYCALYPEGHPIERSSLIEHLLAEGIIREKKTRKLDILKGIDALRQLQKACLLTKTVDYLGAECVKMHNLIRDMSMQITSCSRRYLIQAGLGLKSLPNEEIWENDLEKVSLMHNNISEIPESIEPMCPKLKTLLLCNNSLGSISDNFFLFMTELCVLDLSYTKIVKLPKSVSTLVTLTALFLRECDNLRYVPSLAKLRDLRTLDFQNTGIEELPEGMAQLVELQYLNLWGSRLESISEGILCKLSKLQYLSVLSGHHEGPRVKAEELKYLRNLETFNGEFQDIKNYNTYAKLLRPKEGPTSYTLQLGFSHPHAAFDDQKVVFLTKYNMKDSVETPDCQLLFPETAERLVLKECFITVSSLCELILFDKVTNLKFLEIKRCDGLQHLFSDSSSIFPLLASLKRVDLDGLSDLGELIKNERSLGASALGHDIFSSLKELKMSNCQKIKILFPIAALPGLEVLILSNCEHLEEIIPTTSTAGNQNQNQEGRNDGSSQNVIALPNLRRLHLSVLPTLKSIPVIADYLQEIEIRSCPKLKSLPLLDRKEILPLLERVDIGENLWQSLEWEHPNAKFRIHSMFMKAKVNMRTASRLGI